MSYNEDSSLIGRLCRVKPTGDPEIDRFLGRICRVVRVEVLRLVVRTGVPYPIRTLKLVDTSGAMPGECSVLADFEVEWVDGVQPCTI